MSPTRLLVIGADAAGMSAAHQAIRAAGTKLAVTALEATGDTSYSACGIPYWVAGDVSSGDALVARTAEEHRKAGIDLRLGATATGVDRQARTVTYRDAGGEQVLGYDELVIATGASAVVPDWAVDPGTGLRYAGVAPVKTLTDGAAWLDLLAGLPGGGGRVVVAGGGYIGVEMAEAARRRGHTVTVITRTRVMSSMDPDLSARIEKGMREAGVQVLTGLPVVGLDVADGRVRGAYTAEGEHHPADLVVLALGVTPNTAYLDLAELPSGPGGGLRPEPDGSLADGIWAAGDCCETRHRLTGTWTYLPLGTHANKQGRIVGTNLVTPGALRFGGVLGTAITRFAVGATYLEIARTGLSEHEAAAAGIEVTSLVTEGSTASGYMSEADPITVKVLAAPSDRRLMGAQVVGGRGAGKRIDAVATALWHGATVDDLAWSDLSYAPPFATAWEIVQVAARRLADRL
ncbi:FAD-dependent oxidoreductase [Nonomuraea gerenzanensis]|uniref:Pyridine nucleotide-disulfide oxidoreductase NADH dehydrogenase n=1 Tax=Nonomuraea gerenzanensis TaxID=93944 RepID=A0A1M4EMI0_9ACTN|nr:FAD-dependent oxidoreductase [Nonomuraea gerenzanensis]UBU11534.1 FAD-dependent oxidoreductase [Nonomuraea gerenzanensis]SBP00025.1 Pyridine nucleotide-disulfide oxidoreductase; NADH dehydrogenase [Nonomuraea gerenzanensis]